MRTVRRVVAALVVVALIAGCEAAPASPAPAPASPATSTGTANPSTAASVAPTPRITLPPPAASAFSEIADSSKRGHLRVATTLASGGQPVAGAGVLVQLTALDDTYQVIKLKGIVPVPTKDLKVGFRINLEGADPVPVDIRVYSITYADGGSSRDRIPNDNFESGLYYWAVYGGGSAKVVRSDMGSGRMLRLRATAREFISINSYSIKVTPGSDYTLKVTAKLPPAGTPTGYAATFFLWGKNFTEGYRETLALVAPPIPVLTPTTDATGAIAIDKALPAGRYHMRISYAGDAAHASSFVEGTIEVS